MRPRPVQTFGSARPRPVLWRALSLALLLLVGDPARLHAAEPDEIEYLIFLDGRALPRPAERSGSTTGWPITEKLQHYLIRRAAAAAGQTSVVGSRVVFIPMINHGNWPQLVLDDPDDPPDRDACTPGRASAIPPLPSAIDRIVVRVGCFIERAAREAPDVDRDPPRIENIVTRIARIVRERTDVSRGPRIFSVHLVGDDWRIGTAAPVLGVAQQPPGNFPAADLRRYRLSRGCFVGEGLRRLLIEPGSGRPPAGLVVSVVGLTVAGERAATPGLDANLALALWGSPDPGEEVPVFRDWLDCGGPVGELSAAATHDTTCRAGERWEAPDNQPYVGHICPALPPAARRERVAAVLARQAARLTFREAPEGEAVDLPDGAGAAAAKGDRVAEVAVSPPAATPPADPAAPPPAAVPPAAPPSSDTPPAAPSAAWGPDIAAVPPAVASPARSAASGAMATMRSVAPRFTSNFRGRLREAGSRRLRGDIEVFGRRVGGDAAGGPVRLDGAWGQGRWSGGGAAHRIELSLPAGLACPPDGVLRLVLELDGRLLTDGAVDVDLAVPLACDGRPRVVDTGVAVRID
ncbi:hypothetical protein [Methylobrevis albus]|uniref:Uncharacterized protein n=1 Tax=Methylobrevis albus TaxID=2793297 RepID=A0A931MZ13_9HYPH|nr:hypothetical protein [Methylobrevis albus]MBH0238570.1 hypothetical protein [Methylobrevis albus]